MNSSFNEGINYEYKNYSLNGPEAGDYEDCVFRNCNFADSDLSGMNFIETEFIECNFSMTKLLQTTLNDVVFKSCKLLGVHFDDCNSTALKVTFESCIINLCSFNNLKMKRTVFMTSRIEEADFTGTDLGGSLFRDCDLHRTIFRNTVLEGADFRSSFNFSIDPDSNRIRKARFSVSGLPGLLEKHDLEIG